MTPTARAVPWWRVAAPGLAIGLVTALYRLDRRGLWLDEAYTLGSVHQLDSAVPRTRWTMSAYYAVLRGWLVVSESVWWMRSLSVLAALGAVTVTVAVACRLLGSTAAALAGVLMALSPLWLIYAREARSYGVVMLVVAVTWLAVDHGLADPDPVRRRRWWLLHTAAAVVLPLLHGLTVLQLLPQVALLAVARTDRATGLRLARGVGLALALTAVLARTASDEVGEWVDPVGWATIGNVVERFLSPWPPVCLALGALVLAGVATSVAAAGRAADPMARARALVPVLWGPVPLVLLVLVSLARPSLVPRYAVGSVPGLALVLAAAVARTGWPRVAAPAARVVAAGAVAVALVAGQVDLHASPLDGWTVAARRIAADVRPGDTILLSREATTRPPFEAAWRAVDPVAPPVLVPADRPLGTVLRFEPDETPNGERWDQARAATGRVWVVGDTARLELDRLPSLTVDGVGGRPATHREVARWHAPESTIWVVLLTPL